MRAKSCVCDGGLGCHVPIRGWPKEERYAELPEAFRAICDKAMPDLLRGKATDALRKVAPDATVNLLRSNLRTQFEPLRRRLWASYRLGLCRRKETRRHVSASLSTCAVTSQAVVVWRLSAVEVNGRWCLVGCRISTANLLDVLSRSPSTAPDTDSSVCPPRRQDCGLCSFIAEAKRWKW